MPISRLILLEKDRRINYVFPYNCIILQIMLFNNFVSNAIAVNCNFSAEQDLVPSLILLEGDQMIMSPQVAMTLLNDVIK